MIWSYTAIFAIRWTPDLSRTFLRVTWNSSDPARTVSAKQKHLPPPTPLGQGELEKAAGIYGNPVVRFCELNMGRQVGNGECWTLAHDALEHTQGIITPKVMVSNGTSHGQCIYHRDAQSTISGRLEDVRRGDIVQYLECKFERRQGGRLVHSESAGAPDHTSYAPFLAD
jgi:myosin tail region-interacting protein MTI1